MEEIFRLLKFIRSRKLEKEKEKITSEKQILDAMDKCEEELTLAEEEENKSMQRFKRGLERLNKLYPKSSFGWQAVKRKIELQDFINSSGMETDAIGDYYMPYYEDRKRMWRREYDRLKDALMKGEHDIEIKSKEEVLDDDRRAY